jgi:rhodanese-related sulfurtransferase
MNINLTASEFLKKMESLPEPAFIDVRTPQEFEGGHLENAINYDWNRTGFQEQTSKLDKSAPVFVYCLSGGRSGAAAN